MLRIVDLVVYSQIKYFFRAQDVLEGHHTEKNHISQRRLPDLLEHRYPIQGQGYPTKLWGALGQWVAVHMPGIHDLVDCRRDTWAERDLLLKLAGVSTHSRYALLFKIQVVFFSVHVCPSPSHTNLFCHGASLRDGSLRR